MLIDRRTRHKESLPARCAGRPASLRPGEPPRFLDPGRLERGGGEGLRARGDGIGTGAGGRLDIRPLKLKKKEIPKKKYP